MSSDCGQDLLNRPPPTKPKHGQAWPKMGRSVAPGATRACVGQLLRSPGSPGVAWCATLRQLVCVPLNHLRHHWPLQSRRHHKSKGPPLCRSPFWQPSMATRPNLPNFGPDREQHRPMFTRIDQSWAGSVQIWTNFDQHRPSWQESNKIGKLRPNSVWPESPNICRGLDKSWPDFDWFGAKLGMHDVGQVLAALGGGTFSAPQRSLSTVVGFVSKHGLLAQTSTKIGSAGMTRRDGPAVSSQDSAARATNIPVLCDQTKVRKIGQTSEFRRMRNLSFPRRHVCVA